MDENRMAGQIGMPDSADDKGLQWAGCDRRFAGSYQNYTGGGISATLDASYYKGPGARNGKEREFLAIENENPKRKFIVRRLTPTECARLQGFPDWWCDGADGSDSAQYKMWGNGIALPCAVDVLGRIAKAARKRGEHNDSERRDGRD